MSREELVDFVEKLDTVREETPYSYSAAIREMHAHGENLCLPRSLALR